MKEIVNILMRRDGISENEAYNLVEECMIEVEEAIAAGNYSEAEDIFMFEIGLEPDFLINLLC